jgi:uncharacterized protein (TIGR00290 family)
VVGLLTTVTKEYDRISMHGVRRELLRAQAASLGVPLIEAEIPAKASNEIYEDAMRRALERIRREYPLVRHIAFGDLYLESVRDYRVSRLAGTGFEPLFPLWGLPTRALAERFIGDGFECTLCCVDSQQLDPSFAGRRFDRVLLADLPPSADPCGENGEFHTFVAAGPIFASPIAYTIGETVVRDGRFVYTDLLPT